MSSVEPRGAAWRSVRLMARGGYEDAGKTRYVGAHESGLTVDESHYTGRHSSVALGVPATASLVPGGFVQAAPRRVRRGRTIVLTAAVTSFVWVALLVGAYFLYQQIFIADPSSLPDAYSFDTDDSEFADSSSGATPVPDAVAPGGPQADAVPGAGTDEAGRPGETAGGPGSAQAGAASGADSGGSGTVPGAAGSAAAAGTQSGASGAWDGTWTVRAPQGDFGAGYRILEDWPGGNTSVVVGRTKGASGSFAISGPAVTSAQVVIDVASLNSGNSLRDSQVRSKHLHTGRYPTATFTLTAPVDLGGVPAEGQIVEVSAPGTLDLHGVARPVTASIQAVARGGAVEVVGSLGILMSDYGITGLSTPVNSARDEAVIEFKLAFDRS